MEKPPSRAQVERARKLSHAESRKRFLQTLVEGPQGVRELLRWHPEMVRDVYITASALQRHGDIAELLEAGEVFWHRTEAETVAHISADAQGMVAVIDIPTPPSLADAMQETPQLIVATLDVQDPGNVGTIIRSADAAGADCVILGKGSAEIWSPKTVRSTAGSLFHLPVLPQIDISVLAAACREHHIPLLAADGYGEWDLAALAALANEANILGTPAPEIDLRGPVTWLFGNEARGFAGVEPVWDASVSIPLYGHAESLNVAMSAAILTSTTAMLQRSGSAVEQGATGR